MVRVISQRTHPTCCGERITLRPHQSFCGSPTGVCFRGPTIQYLLFTSRYKILRRHGVKFQIFADDTQLYVEFDLQDVSSFLKALLALEECIKYIQAWMVRSRLMFNDRKSEFQILVPRHYKDKFTAPSHCQPVGDTPLFSSQTVRDLGVTFDE